MRNFAVVGRYSNTLFGPFASVPEAAAYIRDVLRSSERLYEVLVWDNSHTARRRAEARRSMQA